jgi:hypothetical protein
MARSRRHSQQPRCPARDMGHDQQATGVTPSVGRKKEPLFGREARRKGVPYAMVAIWRE